MYIPRRANTNIANRFIFILFNMFPYPRMGSLLYKYALSSYLLGACTLYSVLCIRTLYVVHLPVYNVKCTPYRVRVHCTLCTVILLHCVHLHCVLQYTVHCTLQCIRQYTVHCTLYCTRQYIIHCTVYDVHQASII